MKVSLTLSLSGRQAWLALVWASAGLILFAFFMPWVSVGLSKKKTAREENVEQQAKSTKAKPVQDKKMKKMLDGDVGKAMKKMGKGLGKAVDKMGEFRVRLTGYEIPQVANRHENKVIMRIAERMSKSPPQNIGLKSFAVYVIPLLAALFACLVTFFQESMRMRIGTGIAAAVLAVAGTGELITIQIQQAANGLKFEYGLWLSMVGFALLGGITIARDVIVPLLEAKRGSAPAAARQSGGQPA